MHIEWIPLYLMLGALMGFLSGALGIGGGSVVVPGLLLMFTQAGFDSEFSMQMTLATSLAAIVLTSIGAMRAHNRMGSMRWAIARAMAPAVGIGAFGGAFIASSLPGKLLAAAFGIFMLFLSAQMLWSGRKKTEPNKPENLPKAWILTACGGGIGVFSSFFGIGGGTITVPFLSGFGVRMQQAAAVSSACGLAIAVMGSLGFIWAGWSHPDLPVGSLGYVYFPAVAAIIVTSFPMTRVGVSVAHKLPNRILKRVFAVLLALVGINMLMG